MAKNTILGQTFYLNLCLLITCSTLRCFSYDDVQGGSYNSFTVSSFSYSKSELKPYDWRYIKGRYPVSRFVKNTHVTMSVLCLICGSVFEILLGYSKVVELGFLDLTVSFFDLPPWFSSMSISLVSNVDLDPRSIGKVPKSSLPIICLREGSPPLPDAYNTSVPVLSPISEGSFGGNQGLHVAELCYPMQKNISLRLTNEQIASGIWSTFHPTEADVLNKLVLESEARILGNSFRIEIGSVNQRRAPSESGWRSYSLGSFDYIVDEGYEISRGPAYSFSGNITVEGCMTPMMWGPYCNLSVNQLPCVGSSSLTRSPLDSLVDNQTAAIVASCGDVNEEFCSSDNESKFYSLDIMDIAEKITIAATNVRFNQTQPSNGTNNSSGIILMCYARRGAIPLSTMHDYSGNINDAPLVIQSPKVGRWYISIQPVNVSTTIWGVQDMSIKVCSSLEWQVLHCPVDKAGLNCTLERYALQTFIRRNPSFPFESYYLPVSDKVSSDSANFVLESLLSNSSHGPNLDATWTYFFLDIPSGAAGGNIHVRLTSDAKINYEIYARYGGLPSLSSSDYFYANTSSNSNDSMSFKLYDSSEEMVSFYILYARGGIWSFALRHLSAAGSTSKDQTSMSISLERCPRRCSSHGACQAFMDASGLSLYSYCLCDRNHGGFDCSVEIVSHRGHVWQSVALIASNVAAILPAYWALRQKAFAEWVLFTSSGISSGLYHACDVGTWCALSFHVLQFMDFWLSFMAVVSTFVYLAAIDEVSKRTIHTVVAILTALMAESGPTRSNNIVLVIAIGALGLLVGWLIEFFTNYRSLSLSVEFFLNMLHG
ncbi:hypothetical protein RJ639_013801 [Escallonia herrerae]|uniref:EGF-like domain-containing protein n=1 Tax=Escallonia herrerae TaxID=1293975 RepID=A0AA89ARG8_9ASTE|nr:hypothetical protein RJ639_013801 [Escallonia herrerae]